MQICNGEEGSEVEIQSASRRFHQSDQTEPTSIGSRVGKLIKLVIIFQLIQKTYWMKLKRIILNMIFY